MTTVSPFDQSIIASLESMRKHDAPNTAPLSATPTGEKNQHYVPQENVKRPPGDRRSAEQIIDDNPILKNLGFQKDINRKLAYERLGDWTNNNPDPEARADAAYNAARVLNWIDTSLTASGKSRENQADNGDLEGITRSGDARRGTPAGMWKDFTEQGYSALRSDHRLDRNNDRHVSSKGGNYDNVTVILGNTVDDRYKKGGPA